MNLFKQHFSGEILNSKILEQEWVYQSKSEKSKSRKKYPIESNGGRKTGNIQVRAVGKQR